MNNFLFTIIMLIPALSWSAENWVRLGDSEVFYDSTSFKKNGELVQVLLKTAGQNFNNLIYSEIDCPSKVLYFNNEKINISENTALSEFHKKACTSKWKFWK